MSKKTQKLKILLIAILIFIWGNSLLPASISSAITNVVVGFFRPIASGAPSAAHFTRKLAHVLEFLALGITLTHLRQELNRSWSFLFLSGLSVAVIDETLQYFVDGRGSSLIDVWIDLFGFGLGVLLMYLMLRRRQEKQQTEP